MPAKRHAHRVRRKDECIKPHRTPCPTELMCRELGVAPGGWTPRFAWLRNGRWAVGKPAVLKPNLRKRQFSSTKPDAAWATVNT